MNGPETNNSPDTVRELIEAEEREALARFRDSRFGDRLKARLDNHEVPAIRPAPPGPAFRPVWVSLAVLVAIAAAAIWLLRPLSRPPLSGPLAVAAALHRSPGLRAIESGNVPQRSDAARKRHCIRSLPGRPDLRGDAPPGAAGPGAVGAAPPAARPQEGL